MKIIIEYVKRIIMIRENPEKIENWKIHLLRFLRISVFVVAIATIIAGRWELGLLTLITAIGVNAPAIFTRGAIKYFPIEIELMLFVMIFIQYVIGEIGRLYYWLPYFDKFVHFMVPFFIAAIAYIVIFTMQITGKLKASQFTIFLLTVLITMGIGGIWEVVEYGIEFLRKNYFNHWETFQGSLVEDPYYDTMNDLVADLCGGLLGAIFAAKTLVSDTNDSRTQELMSSIDSEILE